MNKAVERWQEGCDFEDSMSSFFPSTAREICLKVLVLGDAMVGKTSLVQRYVHNIFLPIYKETIGVDFTMKVVKWSKDLTLKLQFWDIAGNERMGTMTRAYYRNAQGCVLMFDLTDQASFYRVASWKEDLDSKCRLPDGSRLPCLLLGNKSDLATQWSVSRDDMAALSNRYGFSSWRVISVKDNMGVDEALSFLLQEMMGQAMKGQTVTSHQRPTGSDSFILTAKKKNPTKSSSSPSSSPSSSSSCPC
ncbi:hypothetical protein ACOMHN_013014 [Nucella lapillus]